MNPRFTIYDLRFTRRRSRREEALTNGQWRCHSGFICRTASVVQPFQPSADYSPSPGGEGRGEGGRISDVGHFPFHGDRGVFRPLQRFNALTLQRAFTLVELLTVIAIIGILAAVLLVVLSQAVVHARKTAARLDVGQIANAIEQYDSMYGHMPVSSAVQQSGVNNVTYGGVYTSAPGAANQFPPSSAPGWGVSPAFGYSTPVGLYVTSNSDVIAILMAQTNYPNTTTPTVNAGGQKNPMQKVLLSAKFTGDTASPGVGTDLNYRDPWGNPYLISMDLNGDNKCEDPFYAPASMSSSTGFNGGTGLNGLSFLSGNYLFHGNVMVWSMGPDGPYHHAPSSFTYSETPVANSPWAQDPSNKNHILSWAQ